MFQGAKNTTQENRGPIRAEEVCYRDNDFGEMEAASLEVNGQEKLRSELAALVRT